MPSKLFSLIAHKGISNAIFTKTFAPLDLGEETLRHMDSTCYAYNKHDFDIAME